MAKIRALIRLTENYQVSEFEAEDEVGKVDAQSVLDLQKLCIMHALNGLQISLQMEKEVAAKAKESASEIMIKEALGE